MENKGRLSYRTSAASWPYPPFSFVVMFPAASVNHPDFTHHHSKDFQIDQLYHKHDTKRHVTYLFPSVRRHRQGCLLMSSINTPCSCSAPHVRRLIIKKLAISLTFFLGQGTGNRLHSQSCGWSQLDLKIFQSSPHMPSTFERRS